MVLGSKGMLNCFFDPYLGEAQLLNWHFIQTNRNETTHKHPWSLKPPSVSLNQKPGGPCFFWKMGDSKVTRFFCKNFHLWNISSYQLWQKKSKVTRFQRTKISIFSIKLPCNFKSEVPTDGHLGVNSTGRKHIQARLREHTAEQRLHDGWAWVGTLEEQLSKAKHRATKTRRMLFCRFHSRQTKQGKKLFDWICFFQVMCYFLLSLKKLSSH